MSVLLIKTIVLYIVVVFSLRVMGKRQLGELQPSELVITILISNLATLTIEDPNLPLLSSILPIFTLVSCEIIISLITLRSNKVRRIVSGNARIVIRDGRIDQREMKNLRWSIEDLMEQLRINGIFDVNEVAFAMVETSGALTAYQKFSARPLTPSVMSIPPEKEMDPPPMVVISDGELLDEALTFVGADESWLQQILKRKHLELSDIFLMTCDRSKNYQIVKKAGKGLSA